MHMHFYCYVIGGTAYLLDRGKEWCYSVMMTLHREKRREQYGASEELFWQNGLLHCKLFWLIDVNRALIDISRKRCFLTFN